MINFSSWAGRSLEAETVDKSVDADDEVKRPDWPYPVLSPIQMPQGCVSWCRGVTVPMTLWPHPKSMVAWLWLWFVWTTWRVKTKTHEALFAVWCTWRGVFIFHYYIGTHSRPFNHCHVDLIKRNNMISHYHVLLIICVYILPSHIPYVHMYTHAERILRIWLFRTDKHLCGQCAKTLLDFGCGPCEKFFLQSWNAFTAFKFVSPNTCRFPPAPCHFPSETCAFLFFCVSSKHILAAYWQFRYLPHVWLKVTILVPYRLIEDKCFGHTEPMCRRSKSLQFTEPMWSKSSIFLLIVFTRHFKQSSQRASE